MHVVGVMKMRNSVTKGGIESTPLAFRASVLTITPPSLLVITTLSTYERLVQTTTLFVYLLFYVLASSKVISGEVLTCDSAHSW